MKYDKFDEDNTRGMAWTGDRPMTWGEVVARENPDSKAVKFKRYFLGLMDNFQGRWPHGK